jgi:hypothetical protein
MSCLFTSPANAKRFHPGAMQAYELHAFDINASGVPADYRSTIIDICMLYPHRLMFVCQANLTASTWAGTTRLPTIDTYFMVDCFRQPHGADETPQEKVQVKEVQE